ncbi:hypothetical protein TTHERM_000944156 (macronuclear) [Tetrahymena thermophila SB210]|uniref:Uncharacterized protein n=1 Tax=Tetrahymena thermophila (strain SB210) TaxID=312017 RepID=W7WWY7_TETTS|nr:hypothetical protein TTHERM_000944156 [Tetrahymena thermophila SB210]EWS71300.1 hypothetical protein TTHERM_000944156 [Tetrahymena thermophila SB210]|eukprot:XP_012656164.1 hypothetical protein TTHERM_000944156 [Tetrahymena thermophila SB210]
MKFLHAKCVHISVIHVFKILIIVQLAQKIEKILLYVIASNNLMKQIKYVKKLNVIRSVQLVPHHLLTVLNAKMEEQILLSVIARINLQKIKMELAHNATKDTIMILKLKIVNNAHCSAYNV